MFIINLFEKQKLELFSAEFPCELKVKKNHRGNQRANRLKFDV